MSWEGQADQQADAPGLAATAMTGALPNLVTASVWCSSFVAFLTALARSSSGRVSTCVRGVDG